MTSLVILVIRMFEWRERRRRCSYTPDLGVTVVQMASLRKDR
jgi:hypothetical protein